MDNQNSDDSAKAVVFLIVAAAIVLLVVYIVTVIAVLLVIAATAASVYFGFKLGHQIAMESEVWENRRVAKHRRLQAQREEEKAYFQLQGREQMSAVVDMHYDDKERDLYKEKNRLDDTLNTVKKVKEVFKKNEVRTNRD